VTALFFLLYECLFIPLVVLIMPLLGLFNSKVRAGLQLRRLDQRSDKKLTDCAWIHVSSGEWEYAKPVARHLKSLGKKILVTHFSPSVRRSLENSKEVDVVFALPYDHSWAFRGFFKRFRPEILLLARTDLWPVMLRQTKKRGIETYLFSATCTSEMIQKKSKIGLWFWQLKLSFIDQIFCVSEEDLANFQKLKIKNPLHSIGDTRYDQVVHRLSSPKRIKNVFRSEFKYFVCGSTWPGDERKLLPALREAIRQTQVRFVIVPHEPTPKHLKELTHSVAQLELSSELYSDVSSADWGKRGSILIVNEVGILAELYLQATFAFVGNSFERNAVHSVMEPLAAGCLTFVGPFHKNNREAIEFSQIKLPNGLHAVEVLESDEDVLKKLLLAYNAADVRLEISSLVKKKTGASQRLLDEISRF